MKSRLNEHQFTNLIEIIEKDYALYAPYKYDSLFRLEIYHGKENLALGQKTAMPFKKYLIPKGCKEPDKKIAFLGLPLCDIHAIQILLRKVSSFSNVRRNNILIVGSDCKKDNTCFCEVMNADHFSGFDLFIENDTDYKIVSKTNIGDKYLNKIKLKDIKDIDFTRNLDIEPFEIEEAKLAIENKEVFQDFWTKIGNNCLACGACSAVCPLCYCTRQNYCENEIDYDPDSCFSKGFSCVQHGVDLRPTNSDKIYNWYHHKFVRSPHENGDFLCTGCGRCINACPANINIKNILSFFDKKIEEKLK